MDQVKQKVLATQINQPLIWLISTNGETELGKFISNFRSKNFRSRSFLAKGKLSTDIHIKPTDCHHYLHYSSGHILQSIQNGQLIIVSFYVSAGFVSVKMILIGINLV